jgi:release factor glutamine methyltransferase
MDVHVQTEISTKIRVSFTVNCHMTISQAQEQLLSQLYRLYDNHEAANIADWVLEYVSGLKKVDRITNKKVVLPEQKKTLLRQLTDQLLTNKPVQYVLNEAWFCGMKFYVDEHVLIPRPETEELVEWVVSDMSLGTRDWRLETGDRRGEPGDRKREAESQHLKALTNREINILDIGTGSGCISIALKKKLPFANVNGCDVSEKALAIAKKNSAALDAPVQLFQIDFLDPEKRIELPFFDIIVSNPPYIPEREKDSLAKRVLDFEPPAALFVKNNDPLAFYKAIADFASQKLQRGGRVYVEINEEHERGVREVFLSNGFPAIEIRQDMQGKDRMVKASLS